ncbi:UBX domain-containing protein 10 [Lithohypha guttulata]|uniref:UBX domain-containing protein 10 n=1 Tax=Lithohypha guttulata TaxID=1690604 RepID=UPI002DE0DE59|nr:UBX domain-containing protein 10 [Lithohypha guttulata]KAK5100311.1 UBX domain-containing protein 10 [Lithohypha guttulata]
MSTSDIAQLNATQQEALQTYIAVTDQDPTTAIPLLQRSDWNVQIAISRFFDGEPASDLLAEARAAETAQSLPAPSSRHAANLQFESLLAASSSPIRRTPPEDVVQRVDTTATTTPAYQPPPLFSVFFAPFNVLFRLFRSILSPLSFLVPSFASSIIRNLLTSQPRSSRRQLPPADTARRFIREFEETYTPNPPLPFIESGFNLALENCKRDSKFLLAVLLSPSHDETYTWVRDTLMSSQLHQFLQAHQHELTLWGGSVQDTEGYQVSNSLNCTKFPFAALICQTTEGTGTGSRPGEMTVVMRAAGPMPASELVAKLGTAMTAQQSQLAATRAQRAEQQAERSLREEQDSAYERSLAQDRERARRKREEEEARAQAEKQALEAAALEQKRAEQVQSWRLWRSSHIPEEPDTNSPGTVRLSVRLADGQRLIRKFESDAPLEDLYAFVECHDLLGIQEKLTIPSQPPDDYNHEYKFRLVSPMPRNVIDLESGGTIGARIGRGGNLIVEELDAED